MHFHVDPVHKKLGSGFMTVMFLWMFYRAKEDGAVVLGLVHPWDAHAHDDDDGHDEHSFSQEEIGGPVTGADEVEE